MPTQNILLLKPIDGLGHEGEQVKVKAGYARNYLLPKKLAIPRSTVTLGLRWPFITRET